MPEWLSHQKNFNWGWYESRRLTNLVKSVALRMLLEPSQPLIM